MNQHDLSDDALLEVVSDGSEPEADEPEGGVIILDPPITENNQDYSRVNLAEPTIYHVLSASQVIGKRPTLATVYDSQIRLVSLVAGIPERAVKRFPSSVLDRAVDYVSAFEEANRRGPDFEASDLDLRPEKVILFAKPIPGGGQQFSEMRLREPEVSERRRFKVIEGGATVQDSLKAEFQLVEDVSGWNRAALLRLPISKFVEASEYLTGFFMAGQQTGKNSL
ncbi:MAG: phage tail assembly protein [Gluconobacter japonicus]|uniref:phage tail assembly protein n=1 Tax=Gluconobacter japonicus TaxID=376620 RepID=UPI0039EAF793